jgi:hypothetical protein
MFKSESFLKKSVLNWNRSDSLIKENVITFVFIYYIVLIYFIASDCFFFIFVSYVLVISRSPVTVATRSKAWTVFARSEAEIEGSNPTQGMDVWYMRLFCVLVVLCLSRGLATSWSLVQGVLPPVKWSWNLKAEARAQGWSRGSEKKIVGHLDT